MFSCISPQKVDLKLGTVYSLSDFLFRRKSLSAGWIFLQLHHGLNSCSHRGDSAHKGTIIESKVRELLILGLATELQ